MSQQYTDEELKEALRHRDAVLDINAILASDAGKRFIKYLLVCFDVGIIPERGLTGEDLHDRLGFLRAGNSVWKLIAQASPEISGRILAQIEKERYDELVRVVQNEAQNG